MRVFAWRERFYQSVIFRGAIWSTVGQLIPVAVSLFLTPVIVSAFGLPRFGLFILSFTIVGFLATISGGIGLSANRYLAVYHGGGEREKTDRLMWSVGLFLLVLGSIVCAAIYMAAPVLVSFFSVDDGLRDEGIFIFRAIGLVAWISQVRSLLAAKLSSQQEYGWQSAAGLIAFAVYAGLMLHTATHGTGLRGAGIAFIAQAVTSTVLILPRAVSDLSMSRFTLWSRAEIFEFTRFAVPTQLNALLGFFTQQSNSLVLGKFLTLSSVGLYGVGANLATQLRQIPMNAMTPIVVTLSQTYGKSSQSKQFDEFERLQRKWVRLTSAWCAIGAATLWFGVRAWLGEGFEVSGLVAVILIAAFGVNLWTGVLTSYLKAVGKPQIETRYAVVSLALNLGLCVPLISGFGVLGAALASAAATILGSMYLLRIARHQIAATIPSFLREVPVVAVFASAVCALFLQIAAAPLVPSGGLGLATCGLLAIPAFGIYAAVLMGFREFYTAGLEGMRRLSSVRHNTSGVK